jgi:hypothetical protein
MARRINYPSTLERLLYALITLFFALCACCGLGGCKKVDKPNITDWAEICVHNDAKPGSVKPVYVRTSDQACEAPASPPTSPNRFFWLYVNQRESGFIDLPGAGQNLPNAELDPSSALVVTVIRPDVPVIGRVPNRGGLGVATP